MGFCLKIGCCSATNGGRLLTINCLRAQRRLGMARVVRTKTSGSLTCWRPRRLILQRKRLYRCILAWLLDSAEASQLFELHQGHLPRFVGPDGDTRAGNSRQEWRILVHGPLGCGDCDGIGLALGINTRSSSASLERFTPSIPYPVTRKILDPLAVLLGWGCWLGAILMAIFPPHNKWRGEICLRWSSRPWDAWPILPFHLPQWKDCVVSPRNF